MNNQESNIHFFASSAFAWARAKTRDQAVKKVVKFSGKGWMSKNALVISYRVHAPETANYEIEDYRPQGVKIDERERHEVGAQS